MTGLVLLHGADRGDPWAAVVAGLPPAVLVLSPELPLPGASRDRFTLQRCASTVTSALEGAGLASGTICGVGLGAMAALRFAVDEPDRVDGLVLVTRQVRLSPVLMSFSAAVLRLVPATAIERLGAGEAQLLALLDQVRPIDATPLARQVQAPALVLCGARDHVNRRASQSLAKALPLGRLELVPGAGATWMTDSPELLTSAVADFLGDSE